MICIMHKRVYKNKYCKNILKYISFVHPLMSRTQKKETGKAGQLTRKLSSELRFISRVSKLSFQRVIQIVVKNVLSKLEEDADRDIRTR